jgi:predicted anti-sigma-YlaC factor YlaD
MNCAHIQNLISAFIDCELDAEEKREFRQHLFNCPECGAVYRELLDFKNYLQNMTQEPLYFDPLNVLHLRLANEERSFIRQFGRFFWFGRVGLVTVCLSVFFLSTWFLFPVNSGLASPNLVSNSESKLNPNSELKVHPVSLDQDFSIDQSVTIYQASLILP